MHFSERHQDKYQEDQRRIQKQYLLALEQKAKLEELKARQLDLAPSVESAMARIAVVGDDRRAG